MCKTLKAFSVRALRAIFFDLDGTLVNTDVLHYEIFSSLLKKKYDKKLTVEDYKKDIRFFTFKVLRCFTEASTL
jgi:phosphoglycolate phosphatase-like HAD superfamily hydrolase